MEHLGINVEVRNIPELDKEFIPLYLFNRAFLKDAKETGGCGRRESQRGSGRR